jgi:transposase InsO family protein
LQRWLREAGLTPPPVRRVGALDDRRASEPHQVWQMDAVEGLRLGDGSGACWLRLTDECSGAILATAVFPQYRWSQVPAREAQDAVRRAFSRYGCPGALRVDNGIPWGIPGGLPSAMSLWSAGLGVRMHWNDPYCPEQNGVVESTQGVSQRWVDPGRCADFEQLCRRVAEEDTVQREHYPAIGGLSRRQAYPALLHSGRGYCRAWEEAVWDLQEALAFLGQFRVRRKVSCVGQVSVYHRLIRAVPVSEAAQGYAGSWVYVGVDPQTVEWVICDVAGNELQRQPAPQFTRQAIINLELSNS